MENDKDPVAAEAVPETQATEGQPTSFFKKNKKLLLIIGGAIGLLVILGGGGYFAYKALSTPTKEKTTAETQTGPQHYFYFNLPDILVNLNQITNRTTYLKMQAVLELTTDQDLKAITPLKPRIIDQMQLYLREVRPSDFNGAAGVERLREELLMRVRKIAEPIPVKDLLFQELLFQ